jgi:hypothetical protein
MRPEVKLTLIGVWAIAAAFPFVTIGALAAAARFWKANLRLTLPWLRALRWVLWLIGLPFALAALASDRLFFYFPIGMVMISASAGLAISEHWVKRRYAPELLQRESPDGWWPTVRK